MVRGLGLWLWLRVMVKGLRLWFGLGFKVVVRVMVRVRGKWVNHERCHFINLHIT